MDETLIKQHFTETMKSKLLNSLDIRSLPRAAPLSMPVPHPDAPLIARLREALLGSLRDLDDGNPYALLDFPWYANVGDSVLWMGARRALRSATGREPSYAAGQASVDTSNPATDRHRKTGHHAGELRLVSGMR